MNRVLYFEAVCMFLCVSLCVFACVFVSVCLSVHMCIVCTREHACMHVTSLQCSHAVVSVIITAAITNFTNKTFKNLLYHS